MVVFFSTSRTRFQQLDPKNNQRESMCFRTFLGPNHRGQWHATFLFLPRRDGGSCGEGTTQRTGQGAASRIGGFLGVHASRSIGVKRCHRSEFKAH